MSLTELHISAVGFLFTEEQASLSPIGTFLLIQIPTGVDRARKYTFFVTALHVVQEHLRVVALIRGRAGPIRWDVSGGWFVPDDPTVDLAVLPLPAVEKNSLIAAIPLDVATDSINLMSKYGEPTFFVGLLEPVRSTVERLVPVVRHGTLAAFHQPGVTWGTRSDPDKWGPSVVDLIDCRSWAGFSGSPCFILPHWPGPRSESMGLGAVMPDRWAEDFEALSGHGADQLGVDYYFIALMGVFVGYIHETSIGVVLPVEYLTRLIESEDLLAWRADQDEKTRQRRAAAGEVIEEQMVEHTAPSYGREAFLADLRAVVRRTDTEQSGPAGSGTEA
jgi:hypothetical protein